jgi:hypothetical protein
MVGVKSDCKSGSNRCFGSLSMAVRGKRGPQIWVRVYRQSAWKSLAFRLNECYGTETTVNNG